MHDHQKSPDSVTRIPAGIGDQGFIDLNVRSLAGYAVADFHKKKAQLFYWFFESREFHLGSTGDKSKIGETPLIIWLNGGPGAPSTLGLFLENGPYRIEEESGGLIENEFSWNSKAHIMFWDQPIGTGYSDVKGEGQGDTFVKNEKEYSEVFYQALQRFFKIHPEYRSCPLFVAGESYGGKYVPCIAMRIHDGNNENRGAQSNINLKGIAVGDGWIDARLQIEIYIVYAYTLGYLDTAQRIRIDEDYIRFCAALDESRWDDAYRISNDIVENVSALGGGFDVYNIRSFSDISMKNVQAYLERAEVKESLNVPEDQEWNCSDNKGPVANNLIEDNMTDTSPVYSRFIGLEESYKVLMYTGTFDTACGSLSTEKILYDLKKWEKPKDNENWKSLIRKIWEPSHPNEKAFIKQYKNLTQIVIPNSGHQVPYYKPEISLEMINKWMNDDNFPTRTPHKESG